MRPMKARSFFLIILIVTLITACTLTAPGGVTPPAETNSPAETADTPVVVVPSDTPISVVPTDTPTGEALPQTPAPIPVRLVVQTADHQIQLVDPNISLGPGSNQVDHSLNPRGGVIGGVAYVLDFTNGPMVMAVDEQERIQQDFIKNPTYGLAVWPGSAELPPRLAWGTQLILPDTPSSLQVSAPDGSQLETLLVQETSDPPQQLVAQAWSADGKSLYFSREPVGLGGYIVFAGASSLYKIDIASKQVTDLIPVDLSSGRFACLDAVSADFRSVADHCAQNAITVHDLSAGTSTTIQPPEGLTGFQVLGSARFSPDGSRLAFALAKGDPDAEQGWVAVSEGLQGGSQMILTGESGVTYHVIGWLDGQTLLLQSSPVPGCEGCDNRLLIVNIDGSNLVEVATGSFLTWMDNR